MKTPLRKQRYSQSEKGKARRKITRRVYLQSKRGKQVTNEQCRRWRAANPDKYKRAMFKHDLKRHYGLSFEQFTVMLIAQAGACFLSGEQPKELCIDHCHKTGKVRKLLSHRCNKILAYAQDDPALLRSCADYLELHDGFN